ncbi:MAG: hypothetical protein ACLP9L_31100 [Thermoguttaceae bacterium]
MLDCHADTMPALDQIERLPCSVRLPSALKADFERIGPAPSLPGCKRRFPRFRCRGENSFIALEHRRTFPGLPRERAWFAVYFSDLGRGGIGLLHGEPLYPKERLRVVLLDGSLRQIEIVRCARVGKHCYNIGARFVEPQAEEAET